MAAWNPFNKAVTQTAKAYRPFATYLGGVKEALSGKVEIKPQAWPKKDLGEKHPFNAEMAEGILKNYGFVDSMIDRYVNYIWGRGFRIRSKEKGGENAIKILEDFNEQVKMSIVGRAWVKEALHKPGGYLEIDREGNMIQGLELRSGKTMYVKRDDRGKVVGYTQCLADPTKYKQEDIIRFKPEQIVALHFNKIGDDAYGMGLLWPNVKTIDEIRGLETDMHKIVHRKANSPLHWKIGDVATNNLPTQEVIDDVRDDLNTMTPTTEFATDALWEGKVIDFGNLGEKFKEIYDIDYYRLIAGLKMYEVLLGKGNIAEGLGDVQAEDMQLTVETMREQVESVLEELYSRVLKQKGIAMRVEVEWLPTNKQRKEAIEQILAIMPIVQPAFKFELEKKLAAIMDVDEEMLQDLDEQAAAAADAAGMMAKAENDALPAEKKAKANPEESKTVPNLPFNSSGAVATATAPSEATYSAQSAPVGDTPVDPWNEDCTVKEWLGFNYDEFMRQIMEIADGDNFVLLKALTDAEKAAGYLTERQVNKLRDVLKTGFDKAQSIRTIANNIKEKVSPGDLYDEKTPEKLILSEDARVLNIARSETVRIANLASQSYFKGNGVKEVRWIASLGKRTCPQCEKMNGKIMPINNATLPPLHSMCRCTIAAVTQLG